jgi:hypothetical protein
MEACSLGVAQIGHVLVRERPNLGLLDGVELLEVMDNLNSYASRRRILMKTKYFILCKI